MATVFVRNLPFDVSDEQLQALFSDAGPVRKCFIVKSGAGVSLGYGFVQFALQEDAERAVTQKQGSSFAGRKLNVELASKREPLKTRAARAREDAGDGPVVSARPTAGSAAQAPVEVAIQGAPRTAKRALAASPSPEDDSGKRRRVAAKAAATASGAVPSKAAGAASQARPREGIAPRSALTVAVGGLTAQRGAGLAACKAAAGLAGAPCTVTFPCPPDVQSLLQQDGCPPDIALLDFETLAAARAAVARLHGSHPPGSAAPLWARQLGGEGSHVQRWRLIVRNLPFSVKPATLRELFSACGFVWDAHLPAQEDGRTRGFAFVAFTCRADAEAAIARMNGKVVHRRTIAVDWALSKRHFEAHGEPDNSMELEVMPAGPLVDEGTMMASVLAAVVEAQQPPEEPAPPAPPVRSLERLRGTKEATVTLFAHNLAPDASASELQTALTAHGRVRACRMVMDKLTGAPKGTAFIEFADSRGADAAVAAAAGPAGILVAGRKIRLAAAVSKEDARALVERKVGGTGEGVKDRRNLYLAREGEVLDNSPAAVGVSDTDMAKRRRAAEEKASKLSNPNFSVSATRLHIRNLPLSLDEKALRALFIGAAQARTGKLPVVRQARLLRDPARADAAGVQRSRGMGFIEFEEHTAALAALRALNNSPAVFGKERRPIVEFALEDARQARKHDLNLRLRAKLAKGQDVGGTAPPVGKPSAVKAGGRSRPANRKA